MSRGNDSCEMGDNSVCPPFLGIIFACHAHRPLVGNLTNWWSSGMVSKYGMESSCPGSRLLSTQVIIKTLGCVGHLIGITGRYIHDPTFYNFKTKTSSEFIVAYLMSLRKKKKLEVSGFESWPVQCSYPNWPFRNFRASRSGRSVNFIQFRNVVRRILKLQNWKKVGRVL